MAAGKLQPYARNAKAHGADQVAKIVASMAEFSWTVSCLVADDGKLIAGHGRVLAATQLGLTEAPVKRDRLEEVELLGATLKVVENFNASDRIEKE